MGSIRRSRRWSAARNFLSWDRRTVVAGERVGVGRADDCPESGCSGRLVESRVKTEIGDYRGFYANVRDAILGAAPLALTAEDGYRVIRLSELARQSSAEGRTLKVKL